MLKPFYRNSCFFLLASSIFLGACGNENSSSSRDEGKSLDETKQESPKPASLNFFYNGYSKQLVEELERKIETKFPHLSLNMILHGTGSTINDVLGAGTTLDIVAFSAGGLFTVIDLELATDLTELAKKHQFDWNRLSPSVLETIRSYYGGNRLMIMPYELNNNVLWYNKNIFDKFGVSYPTDGMTWDETYELAKKVTRMDNGVQYKGFQFSHLNLVYKNQLALPFTDPKTNKAAFHTNEWKNWLEQMTRFYKIDGNQIIGPGDGVFIRRQELAMYTGPSLLDQLPAAVEKGLEFDLATLPRFKDGSAVGSQMNAPFYAIPPSSSNKDEAFRVIAYLLSDEIQASNAKKGRVPVVTSEQVVKEFGAELPILKGKNVASFFKDTVGKPITVTKYDGIARSQLSNALDRLSEGQYPDANTALRAADEEANKLIMEQQKK
ncbi:extracellular solute-binding protein [Paenibacillus sp. GYB004]|uniref:ABC transporter substrate-binding protein n=1 Tax=Paenibacillus sp. GYB004 TaxID=2994393 RepID=UPI002F96163F